MSKPNFMKSDKDDENDKSKASSARPNFMGKKAEKDAPDPTEAVKSEAKASMRPMTLSGKSDAEAPAGISIELEAEEDDGMMAEHTVVSGDNLSYISRDYYGTTDHWKKIYEANKDVIGDNPSAIRVGQVLKIPKLDA